MGPAVVPLSRRRSRRSIPEHVIVVKNPVWHTLFVDLVAAFLLIGTIYGLFSHVQNTKLENELEVLSLQNEILMSELVVCTSGSKSKMVPGGNI